MRVTVIWEYDKREVFNAEDCKISDGVLWIVPPRNEVPSSPVRIIPLVKVQMIEYK